MAAQESTHSVQASEIKMQLGHTACRGSAPSLQEESIQHLGDCDRHIPDLQEGQANSRNSTWAYGGSQWPRQVSMMTRFSATTSKVDHKEEGEEQDLQPGGGGEAPPGWTHSPEWCFSPAWLRALRQKSSTNNEGDYDIGEETSMLANQSSWEWDS